MISRLPDALKSSLAYGLGLGLGIIITGLLYTTADLAEIGLRIPPAFLIAGVGVALLIEAVGSAVGGAIGGLSLPLPPHKQKSQWGKAWRSGLSMGLVFSTVLFVAILSLFLLTFYARYDLDSSKFAFVFAAAGAVFGGVFGWLMGMLLVRKHGVWQVALAGLVGFGLGGFGLGEGLHRYFLTIDAANLQSGDRLWLVAGFLVFGLIGGAALGFVFSYLSEKTFAPGQSKWWHWAIVGLIALFLVAALSPIMSAAAEMLTPNDAGLDAVFDSSTIGTHWTGSASLSESVTFTGSPQEVVIAANEEGQLAQSWSQSEGDGSVVYWLPGEWRGEGPLWHTPLNVSNGSSKSTNPQIVIDSSGVTHIVWEEVGAIQYSQCAGDSCSAPLVISETPACASTAANHSAPTLAVDDADNLLAAWQSDEGQLLYRYRPVSDQFLTNPVDCVPVSGSGTAVQPRLDGGSDGRFALVFVAGKEAVGAIHTISFAGGQWQSPSPAVGDGRLPNIFIDEQHEVHLAWCSSDNEVRYAGNDGQQPVSTLACESRPVLAQDSQGILHLIWFANMVVNATAQTQPQTLLYESTRLENGWSEPAIIDRTGTPTQPSIVATETNLHLTWQSSLAGTSDIAYASFVPYNCDDYPLDGLSQIAYDVARRPEYRPAEDLIPYCQNQFQQLVFMSNPDPAYSDQPPNPNGGFDVFAELAQTAQYELLFTTMWYNADETGDSPGAVLAESVAALYEKLKANPEQYPRGLTVRLLTGNPPQLNIEPFSDQPYAVLADLRNAGVDKMIDPDIGWRVEVADFEGALPHSHTKVMIVDGKTILTAGFNMEYKHYAVDHPSGLGENKQDLGLLVSGPVVQNSQRMFDDLWQGSDLYTCSDFYPSAGAWQATCRKDTAVADHVPEVLKYDQPKSDSTFFSMYRSKVHDEADRIVKSSLKAAQKQVDAMHVMFAMEMVCDLNLLFELCDFGEATEYLDGLMQAAENGAKIRLILNPLPLNGIEATVAYNVFIHELENRELRDQVEIRFFEGPVHYKTTLIDNEFLVVGSQNFHYSAYGRGTGLSEYSLGTSDSQAIEDYQQLFEYQWQQATQR